MTNSYIVRTRLGKELLTKYNPLREKDNTLKKVTSACIFYPSIVLTSLTWHIKIDRMRKVQIFLRSQKVGQSIFFHMKNCLRKK